MIYDVKANMPIPLWNMKGGNVCRIRSNWH